MFKTSMDKLDFMSNIGQKLEIDHTMTSHDRQTSKTRDAVLMAFSALVFSSRYDEIRMADIARDASIGRSTLYLHYRDKDLILLDSMAPLLTDLASAIQGESAQARVEAALAHVWSHRDRGRIVLFDLTGRKLETGLAQCLTGVLDFEKHTLAPPFIVNPLSAAIFAIIRTWVHGEASGTASDIACHLCLLAQATVMASRHV